MRFFLSHDPNIDYSNIKKSPVLILFGENDINVPVSENLPPLLASLQNAGNKKVTSKVFKGLNHLFQHSDTGNPQEYINLDETMSTEVIEYIVTWLKEVH